MYFNMRSIESEGHKGEEIAASDMQRKSLMKKGKNIKSI